MGLGRTTRSAVTGWCVRTIGCGRGPCPRRRCRVKTGNPHTMPPRALLSLPKCPYLVPFYFVSTPCRRPQVRYGTVVEYQTLSRGPRRGGVVQPSEMPERLSNPTDSADRAVRLHRDHPLSLVPPAAHPTSPCRDTSSYPSLYWPDSRERNWANRWYPPRWAGSVISSGQRRQRSGESGSVVLAGCGRGVRIRERGGAGCAHVCQRRRRGCS